MLTESSAIAAVLFTPLTTREIAVCISFMIGALVVAGGVILMGLKSRRCACYED